MECLDFCHFEGKTMVSAFEEKLSNCLTESLFSQSFPIGTMLLMGAYLSMVDNYNNTFEDKLMQELTQNSITELLFNFDFRCEINKNLIQLCYSKRLFPDETNDTVEMSLMRYGRDLLLRKAARPNFCVQNNNQANPDQQITGHSTTKQLNSVRNISRESLEHAQAVNWEAVNPYSKSYNQHQSRLYDPTTFDHFESVPVRPSSRVPKNRQYSPEKTQL